MIIVKLSAVKIPEPADVTAGLTVDGDPGVTAARDARREREHEHERAKARATEAAQAVDRVRQGVTAGRLPVPELERAVVAATTAALLVGPAERAVADAGERVAAAEAAARKAIAAEAARRRDALQAIADQVAPVLTALLQAEIALNEAAIRATAWTNARGIGFAGKGVDAVCWPADGVSV